MRVMRVCVREFSCVIISDRLHLNILYINNYTNKIMFIRLAYATNVFFYWTVLEMCELLHRTAHIIIFMFIIIIIMRLMLHYKVILVGT